jgi:hypothetical protein
MTEKTRILVLSANPWNTGRILVAEEVREIFDRIKEGPYHDRFELHNHSAVRPVDLQRFLWMYEPHIVHFSGHGSANQRILLNGTGRKAQALDQQGLRDVLASYNTHVRVVVLNACLTKEQARSISEVVDYSIGTTKPIGDKASVAFAGAFYRALGFGKSIREAFKSAIGELALTKMRRSRGIELFVRNGLNEGDRFPQSKTKRHIPPISAIPINANRILEITTIKTIHRSVLVRG